MIQLLAFLLIAIILLYTPLGWVALVIVAVGSFIWTANWWIKSLRSLREPLYMMFVLLPVWVVRMAKAVPAGQFVGLLLLSFLVGLLHSWIAAVVVFLAIFVVLEYLGMIRVQRLLHGRWRAPDGSTLLFRDDPETHMLYVSVLDGEITWDPWTNGFEAAEGGAGLLLNRKGPPDQWTVQWDEQDYRKTGAGAVHDAPTFAGGKEGKTSTAVRLPREPESTASGLRASSSFDEKGTHADTGTPYDPDGYDFTGRDRDGYNRTGHNREGCDREGYDRDGRDRQGYDREGYDREGYSRDGFNRWGYSRDCYGDDRQGYDHEGYDHEGYDHDGFSREGCDREGYDRDGRDRQGYGRDGYDLDGRDREGYDRQGYDHDGYKRDGYDLDGRDREGYGRLGIDRNGYDREGYGQDGFSREGYDREGYDRDGYDLEGYARERRRPKGPSHRR